MDSIKFLHFTNNNTSKGVWWNSLRIFIRFYAETLMNAPTKFTNIEIMNSAIVDLQFFIIFKINIIQYNNFVKIWFIYGPNTIFIQSTYGPKYMIIGRKVWTLTSKYTLHCFCHPTTILLCDKWCNILNMSQLQKIVLFTYIIFFISYSNETNEKWSLNFFQRCIYIYIYIISKHLKENTFEFCYLIRILIIYFQEKIWFDKLQHCLGKRIDGKPK